MSKKQKIKTYLDAIQINWSESVDKIQQKIKNYNSGSEIFTFWQRTNGQLLKIKIIEARAFLSPQKTTYPIGKVLICPQNEICVQCGNGKFLLIKKLQIQQEKPMQAEKFIENYPEFIGTILR